MAAGETELLLEVGRFDMDGGVEMTLIQTHIDFQKRDFGGGGVPSELDRKIYLNSTIMKNQVKRG